MAPASPIQEVDPVSLRQWQTSGNVLIVDVREQQEHKYERIEGSLLMPLSLFEPGLLPKDKKVVFFGQYGGRSMEAARRYITFGAQEAYILKGGLEAWRAANLPTVGEKEAIQEIPRKAKIVLGIAIVLGCLLNIFWSGAFLLIPLAVGAALFYDGWSNNQWISKLYLRFFHSRGGK